MPHESNDSPLARAARQLRQRMRAGPPDYVLTVAVPVGGGMLTVATIRDASSIRQRAAVRAVLQAALEQTRDGMRAYGLQRVLDDLDLDDR